MKKIAIGADHAGYEYKSRLIEYLKKGGFEVKDFGTYSSDSVDYPDFAHPVASAVENGEFQDGILICGSANGVAMTANKHKGVRAAICWDKELATLAREHNNANVLCIPSRFVSYESSEEIASAFFNAQFEGGRHERRVSKIGS